jgi:hypothetical protein
MALVAIAALAVLAAVHVLVAALVVRLLRVQLASAWAPYVYAVVLVPLVYTATTLFVLGALGVGDGLTVGRGTLLVALFGLPLALGVALDVFWMPDPEDVELPAELE